MASPVSLLDVVALLVDAPEHGLVRGQVGTVVESFEGVSEVEFSDESGAAYAEAPFANELLLVLHHRPIRAA
jgi:hypothetical protein